MRSLRARRLWQNGLATRARKLLAVVPPKSCSTARPAHGRRRHAPKPPPPLKDPLRGVGKHSVEARTRHGAHFPELRGPESNVTVSLYAAGLVVVKQYSFRLAPRYDDSFFAAQELARVARLVEIR
jgi:hypothetical protein